MAHKLILILILLLITNISYAQVPVYLDYPEILSKAKIWQKHYPDLIEVGFYGITTGHNDLLYIKLGNKYTTIETERNKTVLIIAAIHSNEPLSTTVVMGEIGYLLYHQNEERIKNLLKDKDIYFIPVVCPDYYPNSRTINGIDPNRNFLSRNPLSEIEYLKKFFLYLKPNAVISNHTFGRVYLSPYGSTTNYCPNHADFAKIVGRMAELSNYRHIRCCELYGNPIFGTEIDFFYDNGAFAIVQENGTHQIKPSWKDIEHEFTRTFPAFLYFLENAPYVKIKQGDN